MTKLNLARPERGVLVVVSGPSGAGKSTLLRHVRQALPDLAFSVSATTRAPREGEREGVDYVFLTPEVFGQWRDAGAFVEHATVYAHSYGTPRAPIEAAIEAGRSVLLDIDVQGSAQIRQTMPDAVHVFVLPPSLEELERRLRGRGTDEEAVIARRMAQAEGQLRQAHTYDYIVVNDDQQAAQAQLLGVVVAELARTARHAGRVAKIVQAAQRRNA